MLSVNKSQLPNSVTLNQKSDDVQNTNISAEPKEQITELSNNYYPPAFKGKIPNKLICEGNIKEKIEKLDILNDSEGLDKVLKEYTDDMDKCTLASSYEEYDGMVKLVNKKWECLSNKMTDLCAHEDKEISQKAECVCGEKFMPALLHFQEVFSKMDNSEMVKKGYNESKGAKIL